MAALRQAGTHPDDSDVLIQAVTSGASASKTRSSFRSHVGRGSKLHDFVGLLAIRFLTSCTESGGKDSSSCLAGVQTDLVSELVCVEPPISSGYS